jgi:hypothetical protein
MHRSLRGSIILVLVTAFSASPWAAEGAQICPAGPSAPLGAAFAGLSAQVGAAMGTPIECAHTDRDTGNEVQQTTTGVAVYQAAQNLATFTNGRDFWRLGPDGLAWWNGWHGRAGPEAPPGAEAAIDTRLALASVGQNPHVETARVVESLDGDGSRMVLEHDGKAVVVEVGAECLRDRPLSSPVAFVISRDLFAEPGSRLVLEVGGRECLIATSSPRPAYRPQS